MNVNFPSERQRRRLQQLAPYHIPSTRYFKTREDFDVSVGRDFITSANQTTSNGQIFLVGLAHGQSPAGAYEYILGHFHEIVNPNLLYFTATNSHLKRQRNLKNIVNATEFLKKLLDKNYIEINQVIGRRYNREKMQDYADDYNILLQHFLNDHNKTGLDYVFMASDPRGRVAAITRKSKAFDSDEIMTVVRDRKEEELTLTPEFLKESKRIAFLATKSDKRRALALLYSRWAKKNESPSFLRFIPNVEQVMTVYIDDRALTWPQIAITRKTKYGDSEIKIDTANPFNPKAKKKLPVILLVHGFLGLNSFDGLLTKLPSRKYIGAAMHYGTIPNDLPPKEYAKHVMLNIDFSIKYFGELGHPVYLFDHSMGNIFFLMMNEKYDELDGVNQYLKGRIGANPFFGFEAKHAFIGFLDNVIIPSFSIARNPIEKTSLLAMRNLLIPIMPRREVRRQGIQWTGMAINRNSIVSDGLWEGIKTQTIDLMLGLDSVPALNRIPIEKALNRLPPKIFAIQIFACLIESKKLDVKQGIKNMEEHDIKILILKSENDGIAKYVPKFYNSEKVTVMGVTDFRERDFFREHLYHMVNPVDTCEIIDEFITSIEEKNN